MGFFTDLRQAVKNLALLGEFFQGDERQRMDRYALEREYYEGDHRQQLKVKVGQADDNITSNFIGLAVDRSNSMLLGQGIDFDMPGDPEYEDDPETGKKIKKDQPNQLYIDEVWEANKKDILLHKLAQFGGMHGTCYLKIIPEAIPSQGDEDTVLLPRLLPLDPAYMEIIPMPEDIDTVLMYRMTFSIKVNGKIIGRKEEVERIMTTVDENGTPTQRPEEIAGFLDAGWKISNYIKRDNGQWALMDAPEIWQQDFPPILHWQNLPLAGSVYGKPDVSPDVIQLQDRYNFVSGNINRIIRYHASPKTWGRMAGSSTRQTWGADEMVIYNSPDAYLENLEMQSDLVSSREFLRDLRQSLFAITRTVDIETVTDKIGALTNFGLRVLYKDALDKLGSKQELYGEALVEINHRLLILRGGFEDMGGGEVVWPDPLPVNEEEETQGLEFDLNNGLASKETAATARGYDWIEERNRIAKEKEEEGKQTSSLGSFFLEQFDKGNVGNNQGVNNG